MIKINLSAYVRDLAERVAATFIEGFISTFVITQATDKQMWLSAVGGGVAAALALLKGLSAKTVGNSDSASLNKGT
jgi:hypothetical protein